MSEHETLIEACMDVVRKAFPQERSVYDVIAAHQALEALVAVVEAASHLNERAKVDLSEWYADDGDSSDPDFTYFIDLAATLASLAKAAA